MTEHLQYIGNPYGEHYKKQQEIYARNIWDMTEFKGKLYFGGGNSSNKGPASNAGPVPIISYDPTTDSFATVFRTSEEQVDNFYKINNALYIPGHDPKENWNLGNLYTTIDGNVWLKKRNIPLGVHTFCLTTFNERLFAGLGTAKGAGIATSDDFGDSWQLHTFPETSRVYEFLKIDNKLYATNTIMSNELSQTLQQATKRNWTQAFEYTNKKDFSPRYDLNSNTFFPDTLLKKGSLFYKITRPQTSGLKSVYIGAYLHNDMNSIPFGIYVATALDKDTLSVKRVLENNGTPWDTYKEGKYVYVLTNKIVESTVEVTIFRSIDLAKWDELFYFETQQLIRSFVVSRGTFYFSLGCEIKDPMNWTMEELKKNTGKILKIVPDSTKDELKSYDRSTTI